MAVATNDIVRVTAKFLYNSSNVNQNVFHLQNIGSSVTEADAIDDLLEVLEAVYAILTDLIAVINVFQEIRAVNVTQEIDVGTGIPIDTTPFVDSGQGNPPQSAYGLGLTTDRLNVRGYKFFGPTQEAAVNNSGILAAATILDLAAAGDALTAVQVATNTSWVFGVVASLDGAWLPFRSYGISPTAVTQRRRRSGVGI